MPSKEDLLITIRVLQYYGVHVKAFSNLQVCFCNCIRFYNVNFNSSSSTSTSIFTLEVDLPFMVNI